VQAKLSSLLRTLPGFCQLHEFLAARRIKRKFKGQSTAEIFTSIYTSNQWRSEVSRSGQGSDDVQTRVISRELSRLLCALGANSLLDVPCGDFHWMSKIDLGGIEYIGGDIVLPLIQTNRKKFGSARRRFEQLDLITQPLPHADVVLVRDCLVHLTFSEALRAIVNVRESGATWLITTTFLGRTKNRDIRTGSWRPLNLEKSPFNFPKPSHVILEDCTEAGGAFADKALAAWRIADLPETSMLRR